MSNDAVFPLFNASSHKETSVCRHSMLHHRFRDSSLCCSAHNSWSEMVVIYFHLPGFALSSSSQSLTVAYYYLFFFFLFFLHGGNNQHLFDAGRCLCDYCEYPLFAFPPCQATTLLSLLGLAKLALALYSLGVLTFSSPYAGKAGRQGDKAQICAPTTERGGAAAGGRVIMRRYRWASRFCRTGTPAS